MSGATAHATAIATITAPRPDAAAYLAVAVRGMLFLGSEGRPSLRAPGRG